MVAPPTEQQTGEKLAEVCANLCGYLKINKYAYGFRVNTWWLLTDYCTLLFTEAAAISRLFLHR